MSLLGLLGLLVLDTSASWLRMFIALFVSIAISFVVGTFAATSRTAERIIIPVVDILQTIPILVFFPFAIAVFVGILPGFIGINAAVIFLIVTSMIWNIIFGVYESIKTLPSEFLEVMELYHFDFWTRVRQIYIPASFPRIVEQSIFSWSVGLFFLVTSEIFSAGSQNYHVTYGIGSALVTLPSTNFGAYLWGLVVFIGFVIATRFLFFKPLEDYATSYTKPLAKTEISPYQKMVGNILRSIIQKKYIRDIHKITKEIRIGNIRTAHRHEYNREAKTKTMVFWAVLLGAAMAILIYTFYSQPKLVSYELQVLPALGFSFLRIWGAFIVISAIVLPVCVYLIFLSNKVQQYSSLFQIIASIPATILLPLIVSVFASSAARGELTAFTIFVFSGIWYMMFSILASSKMIPKNVFVVKKLFGLKGVEAWKQIYLRALLPGFITGALTGIAAEWNASIVAEYFTTSGIVGSHVVSSVGIGIGKLLDLSIAPGQGFGLLAVALLNFVVMILLINTLLWKRAYRNISKVYG